MAQANKENILSEYPNHHADPTELAVLLEDGSMHRIGHRSKVHLAHRPDWQSHLGPIGSIMVGVSLGAVALC